MSLSVVADFIVDTADLAVLLPTAALVFVALWIRGAPRFAFTWALALGICGCAIAILKLGVHMCGHSLATYGLRSPSGHTALGTAVYGSLAVLATRRASGSAIKIGLIALVAGWLTAIAASSVVIHAHTVLDVAVGLVVGAASIWLFRAWTGDGAREDRSFVGPLVVAGAILVTLHGYRIDAEGTIERLAALIGRSTGCSDALAADPLLLVR